MRLFLIASALVALSACASQPLQSPERAYELAQEAIDASDADEATRLLRASADAGYLHAISELASGYRRGYYSQTPSTLSGPDAGARYLPTRQSDWESRRWTNHYLRLLRQPTDNPEIRRRQAYDLLYGRPDASDQSALYAAFSMGQDKATDAQRDSAFAILHELVDAGDGRAAYRLAWAHKGTPRHVAYLDQAIALGHAPACFWKAHALNGRQPEQVAAFLDAYEACETMPDWTPPPSQQAPRARILDTLQREVAKGNQEARVMLDRLVALGAFPNA